MNVLTERVDCTTTSKLLTYVSSDRRDWDETLPYIRLHTVPFDVILSVILVFIILFGWGSTLASDTLVPSTVASPTEYVHSAIAWAVAADGSPIH